MNGQNHNRLPWWKAVEGRQNSFAGRVRGQLTSGKPRRLAEKNS